MQIRPNYLMTYKILVTIYTLGWLITSIVFYATSNETDHDHNWIYYLSNQIYILMVVYFIFSTGVLIHAYYKHFRLVRVKDVLNKLNATSASSRPVTLRQMVNQWSSEAASNNDSVHASISSSTAPPRVILVTLWVIYTALVPLTYMVTLQWFINLSNVPIPTNNPLNLAIFINLNIINSVIITIELILSLIPIRIYHFYVPTLYACFYCLIVYIIWLIWRSSDQPTFEVFNGSGFSALSFLGYLGFIIVVHLVHAISYRVKLWLYYDVILPRFEKSEREKGAGNDMPGGEDIIFERFPNPNPDISIRSLAAANVNQSN